MSVLNSEVREALFMGRRNMAALKSILLVLLLQLGYLSGLPVLEDGDKSAEDGNVRTGIIEDARTDKAVEARLVDIIADLEKSIRTQPRKLGRVDHDEDGSTHVENLLNLILDQVERGHVSLDALSHWLQQLKEEHSNHEISTERLNAFVITLKEKLAGTVYGDACCMFG